MDIDESPVQFGFTIDDIQVWQHDLSGGQEGENIVLKHGKFNHSQH